MLRYYSHSFIFKGKKYDVFKPTILGSATTEIRLVR
jgi:hypothetical protein